MTDIITYIRNINDRTIFGVEEKQFRTYGKVIKGINFTPCIEYMKDHTVIPTEGNIYQTSVEELEIREVVTEVSVKIYGGNDIQIGYCNGKSSNLNGMEYHKGSEVLVAVTDCMLFLGHIWDMEHNRYIAEKAEVFFVKAGEAIELYQTTLHLSPCKVYESGFKAIIILPRGTNTDFDKSPFREYEEEKILFKKNKWIISHPDWEPLRKQGVVAGVEGERIHLRYIEDNRKKEQ